MYNNKAQIKLFCRRTVCTYVYRERELPPGLLVKEDQAASMHFFFLSLFKNTKEICESINYSRQGSFKTPSTFKQLGVEISSCVCARVRVCLNTCACVCVFELTIVYM